MTRAMVMAAGAGTRLFPLTLAIPKPMIPICNRPVLEYTVENLFRHGIREMVFNLHSFPELIRQHFRNGQDFGVNIEYSHEKKLLGTAGGVKKAELFLRAETFIVMSGDGLTSVNLQELLKLHRNRRSLASMGIKGVDTRFDYGVTLTGKNGRISKFIEKPYWKDVFSNTVNTGIYIFEPSILGRIPKNTVYDFGHELWPTLLKNNEPIFGFPVDAYWCDVGNLSEYRKAQKDMLDRKVGFTFRGKERLKGVWCEGNPKIHPSVKFKGPCLLGKNVTIEKDVKMGPHVVIGHGTTIRSKSRILDSTLWNNVTIGAGSRLTHCIVGHNARVPKDSAIYDGEVVKF